MGRKAQSHGDGMRDEGEQRVDVWLDLREEKKSMGGWLSWHSSFLHTQLHTDSCVPLYTSLDRNSIC